MPHSIKFDDETKVHYTTNDPDEHFGIADFENGEWRGYRRDYDGTRWYPDRSKLNNAEAIGKIYTSLEPVAKLLGVEVLSDTTLRHNCRRTLLDKYAQFVGEREVQVGVSTYNPGTPMIRRVRTYLLKTGTYVHLMSPTLVGDKNTAYIPESELDSGRLAEA